MDTVTYNILLNKDMKEGGGGTMSNNVYAFQALKHHGCEIYALLSDKSNDTIKMCKESWTQLKKNTFYYKMMVQKFRNMLCIHNIYMKLVY